MFIGESNPKLKTTLNAFRLLTIGIEKVDEELKNPKLNKNKRKEFQSIRNDLIKGKKEFKEKHPFLKNEKE